MFDRGNLGHLTQLCNRKSTLLIGKSSINGLFSIAMLNYQMVNNRTSHVGPCCHWSVSCCVLQVLWLFLRWENIKVPCQSSSTTSADAHSSGVMDGLLTHAGDVCWINPMEIPHMAAFPTCPVGKKPGPPRTLIGSYLYHQCPLIITNIPYNPVQSITHTANHHFWLVKPQFYSFWSQKNGPRRRPWGSHCSWRDLAAILGFEWLPAGPLKQPSAAVLRFCFQASMFDPPTVFIIFHTSIRAFHWPGNGRDHGRITRYRTILTQMFTNPLQQKHSGSCLRPPLTVIIHVTGLQLRC